MNRPASVEGDDRVCLFCALTLPPDALDALVAWQRQLPQGTFRVVPRENLHVTLAFLGGRPRLELPAIGAELEAAAGLAAPIVLRPDRYRETRSVGMLVLHDEAGAATALAHDLHERLRRIGAYEPERRRWHPHVTVMRFRERPRLDPPVPSLGGVGPSGAGVFMSQLRPTGAQYVVVQEFGLGG